ncbi:MAG: hypothetical protein VX347_03135 [Bacteroidota bacterium]|nr:hypothetical protein [Bacteroidota bacterium]
MKHISILFFLFLSLSLYAQENEWKGIMIDYTHQFPTGILSERFGNNSSIGLTYLQEQENNFFYGVEIEYMFGNNINEDSLFNGITTSDGSIIDGNGYLANILLYERGLSSHIIFGYAIHFKENKKHGVYLSSGIGYLQHKIYIEKNKTNIPQLSDDYENGYDRFTNGLSTKLAMDYMYKNSKNNYHIIIGFETIYAFTKNRRPYLFNEMQYAETDLRKDILLGIKCGFILPFGGKNKEEFHYY